MIPINTWNGKWNHTSLQTNIMPKTIKWSWYTLSIKAQYNGNKKCNNEIMLMDTHSELSLRLYDQNNHTRKMLNGIIWIKY